MTKPPIKNLNNICVIIRVWMSCNLSFLLPLTLLFILLGGFGWIDQVARSTGLGMIGTGLIFAGMLLLISQVIEMPFDIYSTFVIEERYGFNKTTVKTFILDKIKALLLTCIIGGVLFAAILWFFSRTGEYAWLFSWLVLSGVQMILMYIAPAVILPMFNKFIPLEDGELKAAIETYAEKQNFKLKGIFKIDGSRRSTKSNAYFTGFGRWKRIALFDTLIDKHSVKELLAVLAHEVGHYKLGHIRKTLIISILSSGFMFYILSLFITKPGLYAAFQIEMTPISGYMPIYAGMVLFGFLYAPISFVLSIISNYLSRCHEYQADAYAVITTGEKEMMIQALKRLSVDNLSNLTPHPLKVIMEYSHPPVLQRIAAIDVAKIEQGG